MKIFFATVLVTAFGLAQFSQAHNSAFDHQPHYKPGADVLFSHNFDGETRIGEFKKLKLKFESHSLPENKPLKITFNPSSGLEVIEGFTFEMPAHNQVVELPITITARKNGRQYLGIHAEVVDINGHASFRVFELPIQVGERVQQTTATANKVSYSSSGRRLSVLTSKERVSN